MKKLYYIMICVLLAACMQQEEDLGKQMKPTTRGVVNSTTTSVTNPTLLTDWENLTTVVLNTSTPTNHKTATLPWVSGATTLIPPSIRDDIKKEDGWTMLLHTFKNYGEDEKSNYMIFYNQFRGLLKVFYYLNETPYPNNHFIWSIQTDNGSGTSLFDTSFPITVPADAAPKNNKLVVTNAGETPSFGLNYGWNAFTIEVPYHLQEYRNLTFTIQGYNKQISDFTFLGKTESTTTGTSITTVPNTQNPEASKSKATLSGNEAKNGINNIYYDVNIQLGESVKNAIKEIPNKGYVAAIEDGLKYKGNISAYEKTSVTRATETSVVNYSTHGTMNLSGNMSTTLTSAVATLSNVSLYNEQQGDLGVWSLSSKPTIHYERYSTIVRSSVHPAIGIVHTPEKRLRANVIINPALEKYIIEKSIDTDIVSCDSINGEKHRTAYFSNKFVPPVIYRDNQIKLRECTNHYSFQIDNNAPSNLRPLYDWGDIGNDNDLALITVKLVFNYNGRIITTISSKLFQPVYVDDGDYIIAHGGYFIAGRHQPPR